MADHKYYVGSAKQAADCLTTTLYLINHIQNTYRRGQDIAKALETGIEIDFTEFTPKLKRSAATNEADKKHEDDQSTLIMKLTYAYTRKGFNSMKITSQQPMHCYGDSATMS